MKAKPSEIKKMAALLEEEAESSEEMAKKVWELVEELTAKRDQYMAVAAVSYTHLTLPTNREV